MTTRSQTDYTEMLYTREEAEAEGPGCREKADVHGQRIAENGWRAVAKEDGWAATPPPPPPLPFLLPWRPCAFAVARPPQQQPEQQQQQQQCLPTRPPPWLWRGSGCLARKGEGALGEGGGTLGSDLAFHPPRLS